MKRTVLFTASLVLAVGIGAAVAEDATDKQHYNGVTYFEPARVSSPADSTGSFRASSEMAMNGITYFGENKTEQAPSQAAGGSERRQEPAEKLSNGITVF